MPRSPVMCDRLQSVLIEGGFDGFAEAACRSYYAARSWGRLGAAGALFPHAPGGLLRGHRAARAGVALLGFPRNGSFCGWKAGIGYRTIPGCHGPARACPMISPHGDLRLGSGSDRRGRSGQGRAHRGRCLDHGANAALRNIVRRDTGEGYREMLSAWPRKAASINGRRPPWTWNAI